MYELLDINYTSQRSILYFYMKCNIFVCSNFCPHCCARVNEFFLADIHVFVYFKFLRGGLSTPRLAKMKHSS